MEGASVGLCRGQGPQQGWNLYGDKAKRVAGRVKYGSWLAGEGAGRSYVDWVCCINLDMVGLTYVRAKWGRLGCGGLDTVEGLVKTVNVFDKSFRGARRMWHFKMRVAKNARENSVYSGTDCTFPGLLVVHLYRTVKSDTAPYHFVSTVYTNNCMEYSGVKELYSAAQSV
jgi:hypothetical protein